MLRMRWEREVQLIDFRGYGRSVGSLILGERCVSIDVTLLPSRLSIARSSRSIPSIPDLSERQIQVLAWILEGKTAWEIGQILGLSSRTVDGHLRQVYLKLGVRSRLQAVLRAQELGLFERIA